MPRSATSAAGGRPALPAGRWPALPVGLLVLLLGFQLSEQEAWRLGDLAAQVEHRQAGDGAGGQEEAPDQVSCDMPVSSRPMATAGRSPGRGLASRTPARPFAPRFFLLAYSLMIVALTG